MAQSIQADTTQGPQKGSTAKDSPSQHAADRPEPNAKSAADSSVRQAGPGPRKKSKLKRALFSLLCCASGDDTVSIKDRDSTALADLSPPSSSSAPNNTNDDYDSQRKQHQRLRLDKPLPYEPGATGASTGASQEKTGPTGHGHQGNLELGNRVHGGSNEDSEDDGDHDGVPDHDQVASPSHQGDHNEGVGAKESLFPLTPPEVDPAQWLLNPIDNSLKGRKCLVLDLDETLVHSSFKYIHQADFVIPVEIEAQIHNVYVIKRPGVDQFLKRMGELFEVVVFTASVAKYGNPLLDQLDNSSSVHHRLFRDACYNYQGNYIKNLSQLGRPLHDVIIIDNSPASYIFHPQHAVPVSSWFSDAHDNELVDMIPFLEDLANSVSVPDVSLVLDVNI